MPAALSAVASDAPGPVATTVEFLACAEREGVAFIAGRIRQALADNDVLQHVRGGEDAIRKSAKTLYDHHMRHSSEARIQPTDSRWNISARLKANLQTFGEFGFDAHTWTQITIAYPSHFSRPVGYARTLFEENLGFFKAYYGVKQSVVVEAARLWPEPFFGDVSWDKPIQGKHHVVPSRFDLTLAVHEVCHSGAVDANEITRQYCHWFPQTTRQFLLRLIAAEVGMDSRTILQSYPRKLEAQLVRHLLHKVDETSWRHAVGNYSEITKDTWRQANGTVMAAGHKVADSIRSEYGRQKSALVLDSAREERVRVLYHLMPGYYGIRRAQRIQLVWGLHAMGIIRQDPAALLAPAQT
ncbi:MAG: hypothetical protein HY053_04985 [Proteobacteria bacterium]|nr:hypothetical protein [Pseudomonadota bacterium]